MTRDQRGYSLIEALIAALVLGVLAIGIVPLFTQAMVNNKQGSDSTVVTTFSKSEVESLLGVPWDAGGLNNTLMTIQPGSTSLVVVDWYVQQSSSKIGGTNGQWIVTCTGTTTSCANPTLPPTGSGLLLWQRTTTVEQFNVNDVAFANPLDGGTQPQFVHLKRIKAVVKRAPQGSGGGNPLLNAATAGKTVTLQILRAQ